MNKHSCDKILKSINIWLSNKVYSPLTNRVLLVYEVNIEWKKCKKIFFEINN